ncbi:unnamed protein product [Penicillium discolor]
MAPFLLLLLYIVTAALANFWEAFRDSKDVKDLLGFEDVEDFDYIDDLADMEDPEDIEDLKNIEGLKGVAAPLIIHAPSTGEGPVSIDPFFVMWSYDNEHEIESYSDKYTIVLVELDVEYDPCDDLYERYELSPIYSTDVGGADGFLDVPASEFTVFAPGETLTVDLIFYSTHDADINMCTSVRVSLFAPDPTPALASAIVTPTETTEWFPTPTTDYENKGELGAKDEDQSAGEKTGLLEESSGSFDVNRGN